MNGKELREILKAKKASWSIPDNFEDIVKDPEVAATYHTGVLPVPPGMATSFMPRLRRSLDAEPRPWQAGVFPKHRAAVPQLPAAWDWRNVNGQNFVDPVRNQGGCGSCVAFASAAAVEAHWQIQKGQPNLNIDLSEAALFFTNNRQCNPGDPNYGWWVPSALSFLADEGVCNEQNYPYRPVNQTANLVDGTERTYKIKGYDSTTNKDQMKRWLAEDGPLVADYTVYQDFFAYWNGGARGVYSHVTGAAAGGHAVLVVGYDDRQSCWICKNSWQPGPGGDGFFCIRYGQCGIDDRMYLPQDVYEVFTVDQIPYNPRNLRIVDEGTAGWLLTDGVSRMKMFDNKEDARNGLRVARRYTRQCFVGRDNPRGARRMDYITEYWAGNSGLRWEPLTRTDSIPYNPVTVVAEDLDAQGWRLKAGNLWMVLAHDMNDALAILGVIERYSRMCFIGRNNRRPNRKNYIMTYWE
jgi:C1A family cysteine protease